MKKFGKKESIDPNDSNSDCRKTFKELRNMLMNKNTKESSFSCVINHINHEKDEGKKNDYISHRYAKINDLILFLYKKLLDVVEKENLDKVPTVFFDFMNYFRSNNVLEVIEFLCKHKDIFKFAEACFLCNSELKYKKNQVCIFLCVKVFCHLTLLKEITSSLKKNHYKLHELFHEIYGTYSFILMSFIKGNGDLDKILDNYVQFALEKFDNYYYYDWNNSIEKRIKEDQKYICEMIDIIQEIINQEECIRNLLSFYVLNLLKSNITLSTKLEVNLKNKATEFENSNIFNSFETPDKSSLLNYSDSSDECNILSISRDKNRSSDFIDEFIKGRSSKEKEYENDHEIDQIKSNSFGLLKQEDDVIICHKDFYEGTPVKKMCIREQQLNESLPIRQVLSPLNRISYRKIPKIDGYYQNLNGKQSHFYDYNMKKLEEISKKEHLSDEIVSKISVSKEKNSLVASQDSVMETEYIKPKDSIFTSKEICNILRLKQIKFTDLPQDVIKVSEASFSEVFKFETDIYKIIPLGVEYTKEEEFLQEAYIQYCLSNEEGICKLKNYYLVEGKYTQSYLNAWDKFGFIENERPSKYSAKQKYGVLVMENGGVSLEDYKFKSVRQIDFFIKEVINHLSKLEIKYEFEHRDLHWGNILIKNNKINIIDFTLARIKTRKIIYNDLSHKQWLFEGNPKVDEQFLVYVKMREESKEDWISFNPITNVLWLKYIINKSFNKLKTPKSEKYRKKYLENIKNCRSVCEVHRYINFGL